MIKFILFVLIFSAFIILDIYPQKSEEINQRFYTLLENVEIERYKAELLEVKSKSTIKSDDYNVFLSNQLIEASFFGYVEIVNLLIKEGAKIDFQNKENETALYRAACSGQNEIIRILIKNKANLYLNCGKDNETAFGCSAFMDRHHAVKLFFSFGYKLQETDNELLIDLSRKRSAFPKNSILNTLITKGINVNYKSNYDGKTPIIVAINSGNYETAKFLISKGANPLIQDNNNWDAFQYAAYFQNLTILTELFDYLIINKFSKDEINKIKTKCMMAFNKRKDEQKGKSMHYEENLIKLLTKD